MGVYKVEREILSPDAWNAAAAAGNRLTATKTTLSYEVLNDATRETTTTSSSEKCPIKLLDYGYSLVEIRNYLQCSSRERSSRNSSNSKREGSSSSSSSSGSKSFRNIDAVPILPTFLNELTAAPSSTSPIQQCCCALKNNSSGSSSTSSSNSGSNCSKTRRRCKCRRKRERAREHSNSCNSTNDNNQKVTATTANCHCSYDTTTNNNSININVNVNIRVNSSQQQSQQQQQQQQQHHSCNNVSHNMASKCLNILVKLQLLLLFAHMQLLLQQCCNLFKRRRRHIQYQPQYPYQPQNETKRHHHHHHYQHYNYWRQNSITFTIIALLTMQAATTVALQPPPTYDDQQSTTTISERRVDHSPALFASNRIGRDIGAGTDGNVSLARKQYACKSTDVRNSVQEMYKLDNCTIIQGFLLISLIRDFEHTNLSFPMLTEITGYMVITRIPNLISLSKLFPNLAVIRGDILFEGYALAIFQNKDLQDIGLSNLRTIVRGSVRVEANPALCYVHTVNWKAIVSSNSSNEVILKKNRKENDCARCPSEVITDDVQDSALIDPNAKVTGCKPHTDGKRYCWTNRECQSFCPPECPHNCYDEHTCCHDSCLGGCTSPFNGNCIACLNVSTASGQCVDQCGKGAYSYEHSCITAETCEQIGWNYESSKELKLVHYNGKCTTRCEKGFVMRNNTCEPCKDKCQIVCEGALIDGATRAKDYHGCTVIGIKKGLTISLRRGGPHILEALNTGLGAVHTINHYLKVHLTSGLTSLEFFKSLRQIRGEKQIDDRYSLYVLENRDLETLWGENQTVRIRNGSIFFHFNPKLCLQTIDKLRPMLAHQPTKFNKNEVAEDSNGDKGKCNMREMHVDTKEIGIYVVIFSFKNTQAVFDDERSFIGYQIYYTKDPYRNATRDYIQPCSDNWMVTDPNKGVDQLIRALDPYTWYAIYIRTRTISSEKRNYQSKIIRLRTKSAQPDPVSDIYTRSIDSSQILMTWKPPKKMNGKLIKYQVRAQLNRQDYLLEQDRNYCRDPLPNAPLIEDVAQPVQTVKKEPENRNCNCEDNRSMLDQQAIDEKVNDEIDFENSIQNFMYVSSKGDNILMEYNDNNYHENDPFVRNLSHVLSPNAVGRRRRRYIEVEEDEVHNVGSVMMRHVRAANDIILTNMIGEVANDTKEMRSWLTENIIDEHGNFYTDFTDEVDANTTEYTFSNLRHFSIYTLSIRACKEMEEGDISLQCSEYEPIDKRTLKRTQVDLAYNFTGDLQQIQVNATKGTVQLHWEAPDDPNGAIVSYLVIYEKLETSAMPEKLCITAKDYSPIRGYVASNLNEGKYRFRVQANSLAGDGDMSDELIIIVPPPGMSLTTIIVIVVILTLCLISGSLGYYTYVRKKAHPQELVINTEVNPFYAILQYVPDDWEVPRERIIQLRPLGQGSFGMVYEGILKSQATGEDTPCAIKTVNENATDRERTNFLSEASVMKEFDTYHVVRLLGVCSRGQPALVVMELMMNGDLKTYLRAHRPDEREDVVAAYQQRIAATGAVQPPPYSRIFQMAIEIADGMAYLAAKKFVHRDLAARNCMVAADLTVKIGDFGMTRDIYETDYYRKGTKGLLPVRWMPPESLRDGVYASSSDVFSYGVVLWEMATLASQPYQGLSNEQVLRYVIDGGIMERPDNCPEVLHKLMHRCWLHRPSARPSFLDIIAYLEHLSEPHFKEVAFYYSDSGLQYREKERKERANQMETFNMGQIDGHDEDDEAEDATTPLREGEFQDYKSNMEHNTSMNQPAESPIAMVDDQATTHSPFSMHSGFMVSSTPDALSTLPTAGGSHMEDSAYVQPDGHGAALTADAERGYELYDPSPNFVELPNSASGRLSGEQHLLPKAKRGGGASIMHSMSSSMPDEMIGGAGAGVGNAVLGSGASSGAGRTAVDGSLASTSLQPSTGSNASGGSRHPSLKRLLSRFNHKRSGSNVSHKSNISNTPSSSSNTNLTSHPAGMGMAPNLGTIESGGSGSAGSYAGTPRFYTPTSMTPNAGNTGGNNGSTTIISENPNYKLLDESVNSGDLSSSMWPQQLTTSSLNPNYELMQMPSTDAAVGTAFSHISDNPNYVMMSEPQLEQGSGAAGGQQKKNRGYNNDAPNYASMYSRSVMMPHSSSDDNEIDDDDDDDDADEHTEHIKMERMPLSRQKPRARIKPQQQQQQPRSRSVSQTRKADTTPPTAVAANTATTGNTSNILKENWLRQASTPRPPPPNGFIGREA